VTNFRRRLGSILPPATSGEPLSRTDQIELGRTSRAQRALLVPS
jgi:hypothetical protein